VGEFSDLKQQVDIQSSQLSSMKSFNSRLNNKLHKYSHEDNIAMDADDIVTIVNNLESEDFSDLWIDDIHKTISKIHSSKKKKDDKVKQQQKQKKMSSSSTDACSSKTEIDMMLKEHLKLVKASGAPDFASTLMGGSIAYKNRLTSPSYPEVSCYCYCLFSLSLFFLMYFCVCFFHAICNPFCICIHFLRS
jgi:hypothetical protein